MKENALKTLKTIGIYAGISIATVSLIFSTICGIIYIVNPTPHQYHVYEEMNVLEYNRTKCELVEEINNVIKSNAPTSCLNGITVLDNCLDYDVDICFVLAQGLQESHFGTTGLARKTNSVWNVLAFDGKSYDEIDKKGKYKSPDDSVKPYMELLKKRYLTGGRTEHNLLSKYVDADGNRYATSETYEQSLMAKYNNIKSSTKIDSLSLELKKYSIILGY